LRMDEPSDARAVAVLTERVRERIAHYIKLIAEAAGLQIQIDQMPDTPQQIGYLAAVAMQIDNREKQELLASTSLNTILMKDLHLLNRETVLLTWMIAHREWPANVQFGHSGMLLPN
jgi:ATP-dependent Lon protease